MDTYGTITPKWQLHIPVSIRKKAGFTHHGRVKVTAKNKTITITALEDDFVSKWSGAFKVKNPIPADKIRDHIDYSR